MLLFFIIMFLCPTIFAASSTNPGDKNSINVSCGELGDCLSGPATCENKCGCDRSVAYYYNETTDECALNLKYLVQILIEKYNTQEKISTEADKVFQGILISVILFVTCATLCLCMACFYCFRIHYTDSQLKKNVKALAKEVGKDGRIKKPKRPPQKPISESCNVMVEDAGVFVV